MKISVLSDRIDIYNGKNESYFLINNWQKKDTGGLFNDVKQAFGFVNDDAL